MKVERVPIDSVSADPANARLHPDRNLEQIVASLRRFGQQKPIVVDKHNVVRAGNGTLAAAKMLEWKEIAIVRSELAAADLTAYAIVDNRSAELAEWDNEILAGQLSDPDIGDVGFSDEEIARLNAVADDSISVDEPEPPAVYKVLVDCPDERSQTELLGQLMKQGYDCKSLIA